ncbi:MAG TPA: hypothetical protein VLS90_20745 [Thermodesulfobacteriota bacterium]|nr:hypothetical protein [Thermodesulfobacteriota bacterium]
MTDSLEWSDISEEVRAIYRSDPSRAENALEACLNRKLEGAAPARKIAAVEEMARCIAEETPAPVFGTPSDGTARLFSLLLGDRVSASEIASREMQDRFAAALTTVFDSLNQIIAVIRTTLLGRKEAGLETIRQVIGSSLAEDGKPEPLQNYLDQIREAFLVAHRSFQSAAESRMKSLLAEMDPQKIEAESAGGALKFGPFLKADLFQAYKEKYERCRKWVDSGRFREELLREFERNCQKSYRTKGDAP